MTSASPQSATQLWAGSARSSTGRKTRSSTSKCAARSNVRELGNVVKHEPRMERAVVSEYLLTMFLRWATETTGRAMRARDRAGDRRPADSPGARGRWALAIAAAVFGVATVVSGGRVLFGGPSARSAAGAYVGFVVAFNFAAGFAYVAAAAGLALGRRWSVAVGTTLATATAIVFALFGGHVAAGGAFERRTVIAMALRTAFWIAFAAGSARLLSASPREG
jgi:hypothetical protein